MRQLQAHHRSLTVTTLVGLLIVSLVSSLALRDGHADTTIAATADAIQPLQVGDRAPQFHVRAVDGKTIAFDPDELERPVVIITFRGGWCPYCNMHLSELRHVIPEIRDAGVDVMFLSGDRPEILYRSLAEDTQEDIAGRDYDIYSDADANAAVAFGIAFRASDRTLARMAEKKRDIEGSSMARHKVLPVPAVYAIGLNGEIAYSYINSDYRVRLSAADLRQAALNLVNP